METKIMANSKDGTEPTGSTPSTLPEVMTVKDLAAYLQVSERSIYNMAAAHELPAARVANQWRFKKSEIDRWLEDLSRREYTGPKPDPNQE